MPEFVEVDSSESAFLIPLEGDTTNQAAFQSVEFLREKKGFLLRRYSSAFSADTEKLLPPA